VALDSQVAQTYVKGSGTVGVRAPYQTDLRLETGTIPLENLLVLSATRVEGFTGQTQLRASVRGPLADPSRLEAHMEAPVLSASYMQFKFAATAPLRLDYRNGVAVLQPASIQGTGTDIQLEATVPVKNLAAATYLVRGKIDLHVAKLLQPGLESSGQLEFDVDSRRYAPGSDVQGEVRIVNASVHMPDVSLGLDHANGLISVSRGRLEITNFQGEMGGGAVTARGTVMLRPRIQSNISLTARAVRLRYPQGLRTVLDSTLRLTGSPKSSVLSGEVLIDHVSFTPDFDFNSFLGQVSEERSTTSWAVAHNMKLDMTLQSTSEVNLTSGQLSLQGSANLRIGGTAAMPVLLGRANLSGGEMFLAGNRYTVQNGTVDFLNPVRTEPVVNLQVKTVVDQYNITLAVDGPLERLRVNYTSDPALPPADIINLLAFGKPTQAGGATGSTVGKLGAQSLLAQGIGNVVSTGVAKFAGLPHFSIDPALRGNGQDPGARVTVQQRVTSNLYVTYSTDVTSTQRPAIEVDYRLSRKWSVHGTRDQNGGMGFSAKFHKDF
jgi:translocation and assembly module TamB